MTRPRPAPRPVLSRRAARSGRRRGGTWFALLALAGLAACAAGPEAPLPGERLGPRGTPLQEAAAEAARDVPLALPAQVANADWTHSGGDPAGVIGHPALGPAPNLAWRTPIGEGDNRRNRITAAPVVAEGRVFTLDSRALVSATSTSGDALWTADLTPPGEQSSNASGGGLAVGENTLFATTGFGAVVALDPATGAERWRQRLGAAATGAPTVRGGIVYVSARDGSGWAIAADDGRVRWQVPGAPSPSGLLAGPAPAVTQDLAIFPFSSGELVAVFRLGGAERWQATVAGRRSGTAAASVSDLTGAPVVASGRVYAGNRSGRIAALSLADGERVWTAVEGASGPVWPAGGSLFVVSDLGELLRLDAGAGTRIWSVPLPRFVRERPRRQAEVFAHHGPVLAGGRLIVASSDGLLREIDPASGRILRTTELPGGASSAPVVAGGTVYVVSRRGELLAYR